MRTGVDLSEWNNVDLSSIKTDFAILRVGYGVSYKPLSQRDSKFDMFYDGLHNNIPLGAYYYAYASTREQGIKEAENCLAYMGDRKFELPIYYDLEEAANTRAAAEGFIQRIRDAGLKAGIYCSTSYYANEFEGINVDSVWLAEWGRNDGQVPSSKPRYDYDIWQYTSEGSVQGIDGRVDMNLAEDSFIYGNNIPQPTPEPTPSGDSDIRGVQSWLNNTYNTGIAEDGYFGPITNSALLKAYQTELNKQFNAGLVVDGIWGPKTEAASIEVSKGAKGNITRVIQGELICRGYSLALDGSFGPDTQKKVKQFQSKNKLKSDGIVGKATWKKFFN